MRYSDPEVYRVHKGKFDYRGGKWCLEMGASLYRDAVCTQNRSFPHIYNACIL